MIKKKLFILAFFVLSVNARSQSLYFPPLTGVKWDTLSPAALGWCPDKIGTLLNYLESKNSKAFILLKDGKIVIEKYFGTFTKDSAWYWASAGKTLTSFMVGMAQQEKYLSISDTTSKYLGKGWTNCTPAQEEKITIRHQLTMTSALDDDVPDHHCTLATCLNYRADAGTRWAYHNGPYTLLDSVIERATGQTLNSYINQKIKTTTGMTGIFIPSGYNTIFYSKARSMARFGLLILNKGNWDGNQVMTDMSYFNQMVNTSQTLNKSYGYLWWLNGKSSFMMPGLQIVFPGYLSPNAPADMISALGKNGQFIDVVPSQNIVLIRMGNAPGEGEVPATFNDTIWQKVNDLMCVTSSLQNSSNNSSKLKIYPNPSQDFSVVELSNKPYDLKVFDYTGRLIYQKQHCFDKTKLSFLYFQNGIYTVQITFNKNQILNHKLIINK